MCIVSCHCVEVPGVAPVPDVSDVPGVPSVSGVPGILSVPGVAGVPGVFSVPGVPGVNRGGWVLYFQGAGSGTLMGFDWTADDPNPGLGDSGYCAMLIRMLASVLRQR